MDGGSCVLFVTVRDAFFIWLLRRACSHQAAVGWAVLTDVFADSEGRGVVGAYDEE